LKFGGAAAELCTELARKRSQTAVADLEADFSHAALRSEHLPCTVHAQASKKIMRSLAKSGTEKAVKMKFGKAGLARRLLEQNSGLIFGGEEITSATKSAEGIVVEKLRHGEIILRFPYKTQWSASCNQPTVRDTRFVRRAIPQVIR